MNHASKTMEEFSKDLINAQQEISALKEAYDHEIIEHSKTKESLLLSNELYNSLLKNIPFGMDIVDENGNILFINENLTHHLGKECLGKKCWELYCDDKKQCNDCPLLTGINIGESKTHQSFGVLGGKVFQIYHTGMIFKGKKAILETFIDITDRIHAENSLKISETRFRTMFDDAPLGIALIDSLTGKIYEVNSMFAKIAGRTLAEMANIDWISITHPGDIQADLDNMALLIKGEIKGFQMEKRYIRPNGSFVWINMTISRLIYEKDMPLCHLCMIEDITERKSNEELLRLNKEKYHTILDNIGEGIGFLNIGEQFEFANRTAEKIFNVEHGSLVGMNLNQFTTTAHFNLIQNEIAKRFKRRK